MEDILNICNTDWQLNDFTQTMHRTYDHHYTTRLNILYIKEFKILSFASFNSQKGELENDILIQSLYSK